MADEIRPRDGGDISHPETISVRIWRGRDEGRLETYVVPARANQTVLDIVTEVQRHHEPALAYRYACRVGVCGSCAMTVNGRPRWTCRTHASRVVEDGALTIEPLRNMPRIKDLACDMTAFFDKWHKAGGRFKGTKTRHDPTAAIDPKNRKRANADAGIECINCAVCYAACDVVAWKDDYVGPAALNRAWTLLNDERAANRGEVLAMATADGGCAACHTQGNCMKHCPVGISPTRSIAGIKKMSLLDLLGLEGGMSEARLFALQRLTAMMMGPLVLIHLAVIVYAVRGGLSADEILARTSANILWPLFYLVFVASAAIHAPIGLRNVLREWTRMPARIVDWSMVAFAFFLALLGLRAVAAVAGWGAETGG